MRYFWILIALSIITSCSDSNKKIIDQTKRNLSSEIALSYSVNKLTTQGSTSNDTLFIEMDTEAIFKYCPSDTLFGYQFILSHYYIHPSFNIPVRNTYSYDTLKFVKLIEAEIKNERTRINRSDLNASDYEYSIRGHIPMITKILNYDGFKLSTIKDTIFDNCSCILISVLDDNEIPYELYINKQTSYPKYLKVIKHITQPYIEEYNYANFEYIESIEDSVFVAKEIINSEKVKPLDVGDVLPNWKLNYLDGTNFDFATIGKTTILYVSMINCGACIAYLPTVKKIT